jgi:hypothetical protein
MVEMGFNVLVANDLEPAPPHLSQSQTTSRKAAAFELAAFLLAKRITIQPTKY